MRPISFLEGPYNELLSDPKFSAVQSSGRELQYGLGASSPEGKATGFQAGACLHNVVLIAEVDHVDREPHEEGVDRAGWSNPEGLALGQLLSAEQPAEARPVPIRHLGDAERISGRGLDAHATHAVSSTGTGERPPCKRP